MNKIFSLILCFFVCTSCGLHPAAKPPIKISLSIWPGYGFVCLAQEKGFFKQNNVSVELLLKRSTSESFKLFTDSFVDGCCDTWADVLMASADGMPAKVVLCFDYSKDGDVILAKPGITSISELKGKTISFEGVNTFSQIFVINSLLKAGIEESEVRFKNVGAMDFLLAAERGLIDAGHTWEPIKSLAMHKGYTVVAKAGDIPGLITDVLVFDEEVVRERSSEILAIVKSIYQAEEYFREHRDEAIKIMADAMGISAAAMDKGIDGIEVLTPEENKKLFCEQNSLFRSSGKMIIDFYFNRGQLLTIPNVEGILEPLFVKELATQ